MTTFSSGDAAFEGFRLTRENPRVVLAWSIFHFVVSSIGAVVLIAFGGDAMTQLAEQPEAAPGEMTALLREMAPVIEGDLNGTGMRLGIVVAEFNDFITLKL